jgi:transcriptional regulator EpsA
MPISAVTPNEHLTILTDRDREYLVRAIESAIHVRKRHQFFLWAQGQLRGVLPHEILVCVRLGEEGEVLQLECFHGTLLEGENYERLCNPISGYAVQLARQSCIAGPLLLWGEAVEDPDLLSGLSENKLRNAMACATGRVFGGNSAFILFDLDHDPDYRHAYFLELLLPQMQLATMRVAQDQILDPTLPFNSKARMVTDREVQILRLVQQGKSNFEIGAALGISPLTVKNHTQKMFRKLNVQNRAHAVSRGIALRLLDFAAY